MNRYKDEAMNTPEQILRHELCKLKAQNEILLKAVNLIAQPRCLSSDATTEVTLAVELCESKGTARKALEKLKALEREKCR